MKELSELFTQSAQEVLPLARSKKLISHFDYHGPYLEMPSSNPGLRAGIHRVLVGMTDCIDAGFLIFSAETGAPDAGISEIVVHAAGSGTKAPAEAVSEVLKRLQLQPVHSEQAPGVVAAGICPATGGQLTFVDAGPEGLLLSLKTSVSAVEVPGAQPLPDAAGVTAYLVSPVLGGLDSVRRRLRLLGWRVRRFGSLKQALAHLDACEIGERAQTPMLVIVLETTGAELADMERMVTAKPALWAVLAVLAGSPTVQARAATTVDIRLLPLGPRELEQFTTHVDGRTSTIESRETSPSPLYAQDAGLVLVVDDNAVNQVIAKGQLELLGYEVAVASTGADAIQFCRGHPPDMVLMDIDMPEMDGLETTGRLRSFQQTGQLPPFPIVAATAVDDARRRQACIAAGMDGFLAKPMNLHALADEVHRVLPASPAASGSPCGTA